MKKFNIDSKFQFLSQLTSMVAQGKTESLIVTGQGGLGKTYTVTKTLEREIEAKNLKRYITIKGYMTPRGLYNKLYDYRKSLILFDDCDSVLENKITRNILKTALDSYDNREISWESQMRPGDEYPNKFKFKGQVIFISNKKRKSIDQAMISRAMLVDLTMTTEEKLERMASVLPKILPQLPLEEKKLSLQLISDYKDEVKDLNFRTLIKVAKIKNACPDNWEKLSLYSMMEGS